jgi:hypothetical protein
MQRHRHQEFIRFLNAIERAVPAGKLIHVILDNYATHKHPKVLRPPSGLRVPLHPDLLLLAERGRDVLLPAHAPPTQTRCVPLDRPPPSRDQPLRRGPQCRAQTLHLDRRSRSHPRQGLPWDSSVSVAALASVDSEIGQVSWHIFVTERSLRLRTSEVWSARRSLSAESEQLGRGDGYRCCGRRGARR